MATAAAQQTRQLTGVVVSAGKMMKTVKVRIPSRTWNPRVKKHYKSHRHLLAADPSSTTREGDVVALTRTTPDPCPVTVTTPAGTTTHAIRRPPRRQIAKNVAHVIAGVVSPFAMPLAARNPLPAVGAVAERDAINALKRARASLVALVGIGEAWGRTVADAAALSPAVATGAGDKGAVTAAAATKKATTPASAAKGAKGGPGKTPSPAAAAEIQVTTEPTRHLASYLKPKRWTALRRVVSAAHMPVYHATAAHRARVAELQELLGRLGRSPAAGFARQGRPLAGRFAAGVVRAEVGRRMAEVKAGLREVGGEVRGVMRRRLTEAEDGEGRRGVAAVGLMMWEAERVGRQMERVGRWLESFNGSLEGRVRRAVEKAGRVGKGSVGESVEV